MHGCFEAYGTSKSGAGVAKLMLLSLVIVDASQESVCRYALQWRAIVAWVRWRGQETRTVIRIRQAEPQMPEKPLRIKDR